MKLRNMIATSTFALLGALPFAAHAGASQKAADACIQAFIDKYLPDDSRVRVRRLGAMAGPLQVYARQFTLDLSASVGPDANDLVTVRCVANGNGDVLALDLLTGATAFH